MTVDLVKSFSLRWFQVVAVAFAIAVVSMAIIALGAPWYHQVHQFSVPLQDFETTSETQYSLNEWIEVYGDGTEHSSYHVGVNFWEAREPIHTFAERLSMLLVIGAGISALWAAFVALGTRYSSLIAGIGSAALFAAVGLIFFLGFGDAYNSSDISNPYSQYSHFFVDTTAEDSLSVDRDIWGPMLGWYLVLAAFAVQSVATALVAFSQRKAIGQRPPR